MRQSVPGSFRKLVVLSVLGTGIMPPAPLDSEFDAVSLIKSLRLNSLTRGPELLMIYFKAATDSKRVHEDLSRETRILGLK